MLIAPRIDDRDFWGSPGIFSVNPESLVIEIFCPVSG